jgi:hypothetical protein
MVGGPLMMRLLGVFKRELAETVEIMYEWMNPYVIDSGKATQVFGLQPTPLKQAIRETVEWCQEVIAKGEK